MGAGSSTEQTWLYYQVCHNLHGRERGTRNERTSTCFKAIVNGLKQSTTYTVKILAATVKGNGPPSDPKTATTEDPPTLPPPSDDDIGTTEVSINFVNKQTLSNGKPVRFYQIIVIPLTEGQNSGKSSDGKYVKVTRAYEDKVEGKPYITAEFANEKSQRTNFVLEMGSTTQGLTKLEESAGKHHVS
ncbi:hypothetical protein OS493_008541 [Desmophyllum pertusum]|uniref:Fibronectin type-III domain-containing protein n=1 Tax=Desmophyllum pertusum TaxID=174260 RepID=A0A9W9ZRI8_9CNID|nr:hypothetical protein OS493_008541 [Desmophyllum pertusum]